MHDHKSCFQVTKACAAGMLMEVDVLSFLFALHIKILWFMPQVRLII